MLIGISGKIGSGKDTVADMIQFLDSVEGVPEFNEYMDEGFRNHLDNKYPSKWKIKKFADTLKDMVCLLIGCTREQLEDQEFKKTPLGEEWKYFAVHSAFNDLKEKDEPMAIFSSFVDASDFIMNIELNTHPIEELRPASVLRIEEHIHTPRTLLQLLGTEAGREIIHPNIWVNALFAKYNLDLTDGYSAPYKGDKYPNWIITDMRFPNEAQAVKDRGGILVRINREDITGQDKVPVHTSETALDDWEDWDYVIDNFGTLEDLFNEVKSVYNKLTNE